MQQGVKNYVYRSSMERYTDFFDFLEKSGVSEQTIDLLSMMWRAYSIGELLRSSFFQYIRIGDGKYELSVQKYVDETYCIKLVINTNYANKIERFTK